ncbi:hypothetical protein VTK26DRAFT_6975 [Humicola hyalothermophila]
MSWPSGDSASSFESGGFGDTHDRPSDPASLAAPTTKGAVLTPDHVERNLRLLSVPFESLPQLPFWSGILPSATDWHKGHIASMLASMSLKMGRVLTPEEADALAEHRSNWCRKMIYIGPAYLGSAAFFVWRGRKTYRFPLRTPDPATFSPHCFPSRARPFLRGRVASFTWHALRFVTYGAFSYFCVSTSVSSWADTSYLVHILRDERLREVRETGQRQAAERAKLSSQGRFPRQTPPQPEAAAGSSDASPAQPHGGGYAAGGAFRIGPGQQQQPPQWTAQGGISDSTGDALGGDSGYLFDDASPIAPSHRPQDGSSSAPADQGSAWERLRRQAQAEQSNKGGPRPQTDGSRASVGQPKTEQYTYSPSEEEKAYAREQAQKEFDAMLERERRGVGESGGRH